MKPALCMMPSSSRRLRWAAAGSAGLNRCDSTNAGLAGNRAFYSNPKVDQLLRDAASVSDVAQRKSLYQEAQKIVVGDAVYAYLYQKAYTVPMRAAVKGYVFNPMLEQVFDFAAMSK